MTEQVAELMRLFQIENCDYDRCRQLIRDIGGATKIVVGPCDEKITPIHEAVNNGHYDFAMELFCEPHADLNVDPDGMGPLMWELQYLWEENKEKCCNESKHKLRLARALIEAGADPNPVLDGEELLCYVRFKLSEGDGGEISQWHNCQLEHIIEAHAYGKTECFFEKIRTMSIQEIWVSNSGFWMFDDDNCDADHAIFLLENGERFMLSAYQVGEEKWDFYAVLLKSDLQLNYSKHHCILPQRGKIKFVEKEDDEELGSHVLTLSVDDATLFVQSMEGYLNIGIAELANNSGKEKNRKKLFLQQDHIK